MDPKYILAGQIFTPGSPVNTQDLFAGRLDQLNRILRAVSQKGYHAVLFGERGVGKTSLANMLMPVVQSSFIVGKVNCDASDDFSTLWRKVLRDITFTIDNPGVGFNPQSSQTVVSVADNMPVDIQPDDVRRMLAHLSAQRPVMVVFDEFDRIEDPRTQALVADTIKGLSDFGVAASLLLIGVAESISELIAGHLSIERALVQIPMPRMTDAEIDQIFDKGMSHMQMTMDHSAKSHLRSLSQGLPYIAHLLALNATRKAIISGRTEVTRSDADSGIIDALDQWQESIKSDYYLAVRSPQPGNIYRQVLLACAMAEVDEMGYFTAASVRSPVSRITGRALDIPNFARHLKEFSEEGRRGIITRTGTARKLRYRFVNPLMRPYVIMRGHADKLIP